MESPRRKVAAIGLAVLLVAVFAIVAVAQGLGHPSPSGDEIAVVEDAEGGETVGLSREEFDAWLEQTALRQGLEEPPAEDDPQYDAIREAAIGQALLSIWVRGEADERGVEVSEEDVDQELERIVEQQFEGNERQFDRFLEESGFTEESARDQLRLSALLDEIQADVLPSEPQVDDAEIEEYYEANPGQFEQPETRDVRVILTEDEADAEEAVERLEEDDSERTWRQVARDLSIDEATQDTGGLRPGLAAGQSEQALDAQAFAAPADELVGPFEGEAGFYVIRVEQVNPAQSVGLDEARDQIRQVIAGQRQQEIGQDFQAEFTEKWTARTFCAEEFIAPQCANAEPPPSACPEDVAEAQGCPAVVPSTRPIEPGTAARFGEPPGRPQGPLTPVPEQPDELEGFPEGFEQIPEGAPPGEAPPGDPGGGQQPPPQGE